MNHNRLSPSQFESHLEQLESCDSDVWWDSTVNNAKKHRIYVWGAKNKLIGQRSRDRCLVNTTY